MGDWLHGKALADRIRTICDQSHVDCAVAFWGRDVAQDLFRHGPAQTVRIVCDLSMGCNAAPVLRALRTHVGDRLWVADRLHAKVYLSAAGVVIGSANASTNGGRLRRRCAGHAGSRRLLRTRYAGVEGRLRLV